MAPQRYYTRLRPFADLFQTGVPIFTYHKLGPRPARVRLKGLYLSRELFEQQLAELRAAGYRSLALQDVCQAKQDPNRRLALTFDDGFRSVLEHGLAPLARHQFHAVLFLVPDLLGETNEWEQRQGEASQTLMDAVQVREWLAAGHEIGSHSLTHAHLTELAPHQRREEIHASKKQLEDLFGRAIVDFCYPYGEWNPAVRDEVIAAGYRTACTTEFGVNDATVSPFALRRITARYATRNLKAWAARLLGRQP